MQQAKWLLNSLERRGSTLRQCAEAILETQRAFFAGQTTELVPMIMVTLAERLHLHPSTVSRATREKYLQCRQGTYPLRYFFSRALGEQGPSQQTVKLRLLELIRQEDHSRPLSDQKLAELLAEQGIGRSSAWAPPPSESGTEGLLARRIETEAPDGVSSGASVFFRFTGSAGPLHIPAPHPPRRAGTPPGR